MTGKELEDLIKSLRLSIKESSDILGISRQTLYGWISRKELKQKDVLLITEKLKPYYVIKDSDNIITLVSEPDQPESSELKQFPLTEYMEADYLSIEAQAGYLDCLLQETNLKLDKMLIPKEFEKGNYLIVEVAGDSMNDGTPRSIVPRDKLLVKELEQFYWKSKLHFNQYLFVIVANDGIVCKQITGHNVSTGDITCHSWNPLYMDYVINLSEVLQLFYVKKIVERRIKF